MLETRARVTGAVQRGEDLVLLIGGPDDHFVGGAQPELPTGSRHLDGLQVETEHRERIREEDRAFRNQERRYQKERAADEQRHDDLRARSRASTDNNVDVLARHDALTAEQAARRHAKRQTRKAELKAQDARAAELEKATRARNRAETEARRAKQEAVRVEKVRQTALAKRLQQKERLEIWFQRHEAEIEKLHPERPAQRRKLEQLHGQLDRFDIEDPRLVAAKKKIEQKLSSEPPKSENRAAPAEAQEGALNLLRRAMAEGRPEVMEIPVHTDGLQVEKNPQTGKLRLWMREASGAVYGDAYVAGGKVIVEIDSVNSSKQQLSTYFDKARVEVMSLWGFITPRAGEFDMDYLGYMSFVSELAGQVGSVSTGFRTALAKLGVHAGILDLAKGSPAPAYQEWLRSDAATLKR